MGYHVSGIEYNPMYAKFARKLLKVHQQVTRPGIGKVYTIDAMHFNHYDKYDVIYFWNPIKNEHVERSLETKILQSAKSGAIIYSAAPLLVKEKCLVDFKTVSYPVRQRIRRRLLREEKFTIKTNLENWIPMSKDDFGDRFLYIKK